MSLTNTTAIKYYDLHCEDGGDVYICQGQWREFIGCCTSDPCAGDEGLCPQNDTRALSYGSGMPIDGVPTLPNVDCLGSQNSATLFLCSNISSRFYGCCMDDACADADGCKRDKIVPAVLSSNADYRDMALLLYPNGTITSSGTSNSSGDSLASATPSETSGGGGGGAGGLNLGVIIGISAGVLALFLAILGLLWRCWFVRRDTPLKSRAATRSDPSPSPYGQQPVLGRDSVQRDTEPKNAVSAEQPSTMPPEWHRSPRQLRARVFGWYMGWAWDIILTLGPLFFVVLSALILRLDGQPTSLEGQRILEIIRLNPTIYPILFAAIASRFYKNLARWSLERPNGVGIAALEQIFGSQNFVGAFERLLVVRTNVSIGAAILLIWVLSPLGGQGSFRMLTPSNDTATTPQELYYLHPSHQISSYSVWSFVEQTRGNVESLYSSSLLSSVTQKRSPRDLWDLPKIPQWTGGNLNGEVREVDEAALSRGDAHYTSLLGLKIQGLDSASGEVQYNFSVEMSYFDFTCGFVGIEQENGYPYQTQLNFTGAFTNGTFAANITSQESWKYGRNIFESPLTYLLYASKQKSNNPVDQDRGDRALFNCSMETVVLDTNIQCMPNPNSLSTNCSAQSQRYVERDASANPLLGNSLKSQSALGNFLATWPSADRSSTVGVSPTDNFLAGDLYPYVGQSLRNWTGIDTSDFSRRLTTAFNTLWLATLDPLGHSNTSFAEVPAKSEMTPVKITTSQVFMSPTNADKAVTNPVYRANRIWIGIVLFTTLVLEILAILGLVLRCFIHGPDVLGFASSITRDNPYIPLPPGGSGLDGPERARILRNMKVQLADVRPEEADGYIAFKAVSPTGRSQQHRDDSERRTFR
ncbi:hypothetical protein AUP68_03641 [Ilyonectria robusta]